MATTVQRIMISAETALDAKAPAQRGASLAVRDDSGREVPLSADLQRALLEALSAIAGQGSVSIAQVPEELTSTAAADLLGISRPTLMKWAEQGLIASFKIGSHHRFRRADVADLRERRERERTAAFAELRELDAEGGFEFFAD